MQYQYVVRPGQSIDEAAQVAQKGDIVVVKPGVYRERVAPAHGGTKSAPIRFFADGDVTIKGSDIWQPQWRKTGSDNLPIFIGRIEHDSFRRELKQPPGGQRLSVGQIFVDGEQYRETDKIEVLSDYPGSWLRANGNEDVIVHFRSWEPPTKSLVEATVRDRVFAPHVRGLAYIQVHGFTIEHCANQFPDKFWESDSPQAGMLGCRAGHNWTITRCTIRHAKSIGIDCGYEGHDIEGDQPTPKNTGHHLIQFCHIYANGCCGIAGMRSFETNITSNYIYDNNWNRHTAPEVAGVKMHFFVDGSIKHNSIWNNEAYGIWIDNSYKDSVISNNQIVNNRGAGIMAELGWKPLAIQHNSIWCTRPNWHSDPRADGIYLQDASNIMIESNTIQGCERFGIHARKRTVRENAQVSNITIRKNTIAYNGHAINLPYPGQFAVGNECYDNNYNYGSRFVFNPWGGEQNVLEAVREKTGRWNEQDKNRQVIVDQLDWYKFGYS